MTHCVWYYQGRRVRERWLEQDTCLACHMQAGCVQPGDLSPATHPADAPTCVYGKKTRLTAKPVQLPTTTGVLRMALLNSRVSRMTCRWEGMTGSQQGPEQVRTAETPPAASHTAVQGPERRPLQLRNTRSGRVGAKGHHTKKGSFHRQVRSVRTISSRGMMWAGLKKWAPRMRSAGAISGAPPRKWRSRRVSTVPMQPLLELRAAPRVQKVLQAAPCITAPVYQQRPRRQQPNAAQLRDPPARPPAHLGRRSLPPPGRC